MVDVLVIPAIFILIPFLAVSFHRIRSFVYACVFGDQKYIFMQLVRSVKLLYLLRGGLGTL